VFPGTGSAALILGKRPGRKTIDEHLEAVRKRYAALVAAGKLSGKTAQAFEDRYYVRRV